jgi:hypothetical protein
MLEGLDAINWQQLTHAYGPATDVPDLIRKLTSPSIPRCIASVDPSLCSPFLSPSRYSYSILSNCPKDWDHYTFQLRYHREE